MNRDASAFFAKHLSSSPALVIARGLGTERTVIVLRRAWRLGIPLVEVPVQSEQDLQALAAAVAVGRQHDRPIGAGTVTSAALVYQVANIGAAFTVAPGFDEGVAAVSAELGLPHLPGVATATDVHRSLRLGLIWQKAFPASVLGPDWIQAMHGPFPQAHFVATGGINTATGAAFFAAGAAALAFGSSFADAPDDEIRCLLRGPHEPLPGPGTSPS